MLQKSWKSKGKAKKVFIKEFYNIKNRRFIELCKEETPLIRKSCATTIGTFAVQIEKEFVINELMPIFKQLTGDEQDTIRVVCIESLIPIVRYLTKEDNQRYILPILLALSEDKSWKVRLTIAKNFDELANAFGKDITDANLVAKFAPLLKDVEADVRTAAVINLKQSMKTISVEKIHSILIPPLSTLVQDSSYNVKGKIWL
jgi:serine/threonine-protein phosphatase 2A regulatory subunit A